MASLANFADYMKAAHKAARGRFVRYPYAIYSVLVSRFRYGLGPRFHSLFNLGDLPRELWNDYLDNDRLRVVLRSINPPAEREIAKDKLAFYDHCVAHSLPTIPVICAIQGDDENYSKSRIIAETEEIWCERINCGPDRVFVKPIDGTWGRGAFIALREGEQWYYLGSTGSAATLYAYLRQRMDGKRGWLVQPVIEAHQGLKSISSPHALPTIRANTCLVDGLPRLLFALLRLSVGDNVTDNFSHGTSGNIVAPIDLDTGRLGKCRGSASKSWPDIVHVPVHPDTDNLIEGYQIPMWQEVLSLVERGQKSLPNLRTLGWDIAVTDKGPLIVEANTGYDIDLIQVAHQRGAKPHLEDVFSLAGNG